MKKGTIILLLQCSFLVCLYSQKYERDINEVEIEQIESKYPVVIRRLPGGERIHYVRFFLVYRIKKNIPGEVILFSESYLYGGEYAKDQGYSSGVSGRFLVDGPEVKEEYLDYTPKEYIFIPGHYPKNDSNTVKMLQPYLDKMKALGKDSLHLGTITQLKKTNPQFVEGFLGGDSIWITYYKIDEKIGWHVPIPVEMK